MGNLEVYNSLLGKSWHFVFHFFKHGKFPKFEIPEEEHDEFG